jgi:hypothetical protein
MRLYHAIYWNFIEISFISCVFYTYCSTCLRCCDGNITEFSIEKISYMLDKYLIKFMHSEKLFHIIHKINKPQNYFLDCIKNSKKIKLNTRLFFKTNDNQLLRIPVTSCCINNAKCKSNRQKFSCGNISILCHEKELCDGILIFYSKLT